MIICALEFFYKYPLKLQKMRMGASLAALIEGVRRPLSSQTKFSEKVEHIKILLISTFDHFDILKYFF